MQNFIESLGWKKISAIMIVLGILALIVIVLSTINTVQAPPRINNSDVPTPESLPKEHASASPEVTNNWQTYTFSLFSVSYPQEFSPAPGLIAGGGESLPLASSDNKTIITIQARPTSAGSISDMINLYTRLHYSKNPVKIGSVGGYEMKGIFKAAKGNYQEIVRVFEINGILYEIKLSYLSEARDTQKEATYLQILSTFKLP